MKIQAAIATVASCSLLFTGIGAGIGWGMGTYLPAYYRSMFRSNNDPRFDPVAVGVGQGLTQGITGGVAAGLVLVAIFVWRDSRASRLSDTQAEPGAADVTMNVKRRRRDDG
jgi:hypothetical protein